METQIEEEELIDYYQNNQIDEVVSSFVSSLFEQEEAKNPLNNYKSTPLKCDLKKKKMVKNKSIDFKSDFNIQKYTKSKPISSLIKKRNLNLSEDRIQSNAMKINYEDVTQTEKKMKLYLQRVEAFTNRINALKKQENELSNRMVIMQKKEKAIEQIHNTKQKLKEVIIKTKFEIDKENEIKKEQVMMKKLTELDKLEQYKRDNELKKRQNIEIAKASQTLVKSMISQTNTKNETLNKYKYLQVKEGFAQYKSDEQMKILEKEEQKNEAYLKKMKIDKEMIQRLKDKCDELEKIEEECFEKLKTTKAKSNYFQSSFCLANKIKNETIEHLNNNIQVNQTVTSNKTDSINNIQVNQTATTNNTIINNTSKNKPKILKAKRIHKVIDNKIKVSKPPQTQIKPPIPHPNPNPIVVKMKKNASTVKKPIKTPITNRPQSSKAKTKENEKIISKNNSTSHSNYLTNYKNPTKQMIIHKRNSSEIIPPLESHHMKYSTIF